VKNIKTEVRAQADISIIDEDGDELTYGTVYATIWTDTGSETTTCDLGTGSCTITGDWIDETDPDAPEAFVITVDGWHDGSVIVRPGKAIFATDGGEILLSAIEDEAQLDGSFLAYYFDGSEDSELGGHVAESYSVVNNGTGLSSSPLGIVFRPAALVASSSVSEVDVDLDGTGLSSSPLGLTRVRLMHVDGTGLSSSPLGFTNMRLAAIDGTGLSSSPLGFHPRHMHVRTTGTGLSSSPLGLTGNPMNLSNGNQFGHGFQGMSFGDVLEGINAYTDEGYEPATQLAGSGATEVGLTSSTCGTGEAAESMSLADGTL